MGAAEARRGRRPAVNRVAMGLEQFGLNLVADVKIGFVELALARDRAQLPRPPRSSSRDSAHHRSAAARRRHQRARGADGRDRCRAGAAGCRTRGVRRGGSRERPSRATRAAVRGRAGRARARGDGQRDLQRQSGRGRRTPQRRARGPAGHPRGGDRRGSRGGPHGMGGITGHRRHRGARREW